MSEKRTYLFLQGVCSPFFSCLADSLRARGHRVFKVHFNAGDWLYWFNKPAWTHRGPCAELPGFLADTYKRFGITDQILFGDCRPVHRPAVEGGKSMGLRTHVFEEGYFRPFWVTLEREGVNGYSLLPRTPEWYRQVGKHLPNYGHGGLFRSTFTVRAMHDVLYHLAGLYNPLFFPGYRTHAPICAAIEYLGYIRRFPLLRFHRKRDNRLLEQMLQAGTSFFLLPLQLGTDAQIQHHSRFSDMTEVMESVMASFAQHAPGDAKLVIKNHPLDAGLDNYLRISKRLAHQFAITDRVEYMETGDLMALLRHASGTVTVNSTVGLLSLGRQVPTMTLGNPIYNLPGLTFQGSLDLFWQHGEKPRTRLFRLFRNTVIHTTQVNGGFYSRQGIQMTIENSRRLLEAERSPLEELL